MSGQSKLCRASSLREHRGLPRSLAARVALAAGAAVAVAFAIAAMTVLLAAERGDRAALDRELRASVHRLTRPAAVAAALGEVDLPARFGPGAFFRPPRDTLDPGADRFAVVLDARGAVVRAAGTLPGGRFPRPTPDGEIRSVSAGGERWRTVAVGLPNGAALQVAGRLQPIDERANRLRTVVGLALLAALGGSVLATLLLSRLALAPLDRLRVAAAQIGGAADLDARVPVGEGPVEVDDLAGEFNAMLARLSGAAQAREEALVAARRFAADAGHELRTPLTSLRASLATLRRSETDPALAAAERDLDRLSALVEQLQGLARGEAGPRTVEALDLGEVADAAIASLRARHPAADVVLRCPDPGPVLRGDPDGVRAIFDNLLENAARHGGVGGIPVRIDVSVTSSDGVVMLVVDDDGPGIAPPDRANVLRRFVRGPGAKAPGSGLGLAIVSAQAQRHGGVVQLGEAPLGGLRVSLTLAGVGGPPDHS